jgi:hypothetical protein
MEAVVVIISGEKLYRVPFSVRVATVLEDSKIFLQHEYVEVNEKSCFKSNSFTSSTGRKLSQKVNLIASKSAYTHMLYQPAWINASVF